VNDPLHLLAWALLVIGVLLMIASLFADPLALGQPGTGFGWKQILGTAIGLGLTILGARMTRRPTPRS
jgi:hypothetical protein